jgi:hypothetical protein
MPCYQSAHIQSRAKFENFVTEHLTPISQEFDSKQSIPHTFFSLLAREGYLGSNIPKKFGGQEMDYITLGLLHEEFGKGLCSIENALTVYGMVSKPLIKFGSQHQQQTWLPKIAAGETIVALALTEPNIGSDLKNVEANVITEGEYYILNGKKKYITLGQIADLFLVLAKCCDKNMVLLVEKNTPGLQILPINNILGLRSNMLAEIIFYNCKIPKANLLGQIGNGLTHVIACALDEGRYTTAWGCVGLGQACLNAARNYSDSRVQTENFLKHHQLIQKILTEIIVNVKAAREICFNTGNLRNERDISYISETLVAKYFSSKMAVFVANHALQIFGASGFTKEHAVERFYRDAKIMEVIEGTSQIYEINIPKVCLN